MSEKLAILGGAKAVPDGTIQKWPPITAVDRQYVLASLVLPGLAAAWLGLMQVKRIAWFDTLASLAIVAGGIY